MKEYPKIIKLYNRYKQNFYLEHIKDNIYKLICNDYLRIGYHENADMQNIHNIHDFEFVDPDGGPFMRVNGTVDTYNDPTQYIIDKIYSEIDKQGITQIMLDIHIK